VTVSLLRRADVVAMLEDQDRHPRKALGQNFVVDPGTIQRIVRLAGIEAGAPVLEIGPGLGSLTLGLLEAGAQVTAIEKDPGLADMLRDTLVSRAPGLAVDVIVGDALVADLAGLTRSGPGWRLVANLPYNVATQVVIRALDEAPNIESMVVMVQREVADRLVAGAGAQATGIPSILIAMSATARLVGTIGPEVFYPRPRIVSALVELRRHDHDVFAGADRQVARQLVRTSFGQRRKTLRRSLALDPDVFERAEVSPAARPQELSLDDWRRLTLAASP
jgi:16S rRNA (adenine1518-N6/adenine1519-N6)-dimethyltransferase